MSTYNEKYDELRKAQKENLSQLYPVNAQIKHLRQVKIEKANDPTFDMKAWKAEFRERKDFQLLVIANLNALNKELKQIRPLMSKDKVVREPKPKKEKVEKVRKTKEPKVKKEKAPKRLWTFPILSELEHNTMTHMNKVFAEAHKRRVSHV